MPVKAMNDKKLENSIPRRDFLKVLGLGALTGGLVACGEDSDPPDPDPEYTAFTGDIVGLIHGTHISEGSIQFKESTSNAALQANAVGLRAWIGNTAWVR